MENRRFCMKLLLVRRVLSAVLGGRTVVRLVDVRRRVVLGERGHAVAEHLPALVTRGSVPVEPGNATTLSKQSIPGGLSM